MECIGMDALPDGVVQHILSQVSNARDVAACAGVSRCWRDCVPYLPALYFPRGAFEAVGAGSEPAAAADAAISRMVAAAARLEELVVYCPFSIALLPRWLAARGATLRVLELRVDSAVDLHGRLDCVALAPGLEELRLWGLSMSRPPAWGPLDRLRVLEVVGAVLHDAVVNGAVAACPNLADLALLGCECAGEVVLALPLLERCRLDVIGPNSCTLKLAAPRVESLQVQGFGWISLPGGTGNRLRHLTISKNAGALYHVEIGKLPELEQLQLRGVQWSWTAITSVLQCATEVKHLVMKVEFCGDYDTLQPFPEVDLVEFFNSHLKLRKFEIHGAMFASLCQKNSLKNLDPKFVIPCLEEVLVTVRSPLNAEQKLSTLESLVRYSVRLRSMVIRISQMKNCHDTADQFFEEVCKFAHMSYGRVYIE